MEGRPGRTDSGDIPVSGCWPSKATDLLPQTLGPHRVVAMPRSPLSVLALHFGWEQLDLLASFLYCLRWLITSFTQLILAEHRLRNLQQTSKRTEARSFIRSCWCEKGIQFIALPSPSQALLGSFDFSNVFFADFQHSTLKFANTWSTDTPLPLAAVLTLAFDSALKNDAILLSLPLS